MGGADVLGSGVFDPLLNTSTDLTAGVWGETCLPPNRRTSSHKKVLALLARLLESNSESGDVASELPPPPPELLDFSTGVDGRSGFLGKGQDGTLLLLGSSEE